mgnify:CR=1 FL=1
MRVSTSLWNMISFIGLELIKNKTTVKTKVYCKPTITGLLLHFQSHTDLCYKESLIRMMLYCASSTLIHLWILPSRNLQTMKVCLHDYPISLINSAINKFLNSNNNNNNTVLLTKTGQQEAEIIQIFIPYKDQKSAISIRRQMKALSNKIGVVLQH